jgi:hypothetical protein
LVAPDDAAVGGVDHTGHDDDVILDHHRDLEVAERTGEVSDDFAVAHVDVKDFTTA